MEIQGCHAVVTGGASGIGAALIRRLAQAGAAQIVVADLDGAAAERVAAEVGAEAPAVGTLGLAVDVGRAEEIDRLVGAAEAEHGPVDLFCSNAGIAGPYGGPEVGDEDWQRTWNVNVMAHVWAARRLLPGCWSAATATSARPPRPPACSPTRA